MVLRRVRGAGVGGADRELEASLGRGVALNLEDILLPLLMVARNRYVAHLLNCTFSRVGSAHAGVSLTTPLPSMTREMVYDKSRDTDSAPKFKVGGCSVNLLVKPGQGKLSRTATTSTQVSNNLYGNYIMLKKAAGNAKSLILQPWQKGRCVLVLLHLCGVRSVSWSSPTSRSLTDTCAAPNTRLLSICSSLLLKTSVTRLNLMLHCHVK